MSINFGSLTSGALGFTLALAWNEAVSKGLQSFLPPKDERVAARHTILYAVVITIMVIFIVAGIRRAQRFVYEHGPAGAAGPPARGEKAPAPEPVVRLWEPGRD